MTPHPPLNKKGTEVVNPVQLMSADLFQGINYLRPLFAKPLAQGINHLRPLLVRGAA